jgi:hypothetical protein
MSTVPHQINDLYKMHIGPLKFLVDFILLLSPSRISLKTTMRKYIELRLVGNTYRWLLYKPTTYRSFLGLSMKPNDTGTVTLNSIAKSGCMDFL